MAPLHISSTELHGYQLFARFLIDAFFFVRNFKMLPTIFYKTIKKWKFTLITANLWAATCRQIDNTLSYWRPYREQTLYSVSFRKGHFITIVRPSEINLLIDTDFNPNTYRTRWPLHQLTIAWDTFRIRRTISIQQLFGTESVMIFSHEKTFV